VRERIELLLDPGSFDEVGSAAGTATWSKPEGVKHSVIEEEKEVVTDFTPSNNVQGAYYVCPLYCISNSVPAFRFRQDSRSSSAFHCRRLHIARGPCGWSANGENVVHGEALCASEAPYDQTRRWRIWWWLNALAHP